MARGILRLYSTQKNILNDVDKKLALVSKYHSKWIKYNAAKRFSSQNAPPQGVPYNKLTIGVPKEVWKDERRVALTPQVAQVLTKKGFTVNVQENAGSEAKFRNDDYEKAGAVIVDAQKAFHSGGDCFWIV